MTINNQFDINDKVYFLDEKNLFNVGLIVGIQVNWMPVHLTDPENTSPDISYRIGFHKDWFPEKAIHPTMDELINYALDTYKHGSGSFEGDIDETRARRLVSTDAKRALLEPFIGKQVLVNGYSLTDELTATLQSIEPSPSKLCRVLWSNGDKGRYYLSEVEPVI